MGWPGTLNAGRRLLLLLGLLWGCSSAVEPSSQPAPPTRPPPQRQAELPKPQPEADPSTPRAGGSQLPPAASTAVAPAPPTGAVAPAPAAGEAEAAPAAGAVTPALARVEPASEAELLPHTGPLAKFHDALRELALGRRHEHVRIMWLGDSHAQPDFWTGELRRQLQQRFGAAGPGFVHLGYKQYRHDGLLLEVTGKWRLRPKGPASTLPYPGGALGLGGILTAGYADRPRVDLRLTDPTLAGQRLSWDLCYKLSAKGARLGLQLGDEKMKIIELEDQLGRLRHLRFETAGPERLQIRTDDVRTELCGLTIETDPAARPGVVIDNLGINGARYATALAWDPALWAAEVRRRPPQLFVIEYGGNEAGNGSFAPELYGRQLAQLIRRLKLIQPEAACLVVGLTERTDFAGRIAAVRDRTREAALGGGCLFWDSYEQMGGRGSMTAWQQAGKAYDDGIHLNPKGYRELAALLHRDLLAGFQAPPKTAPHSP